MLDERKTKEQLITELRELRQRLIIFEQEQKKLKLSIVEGMRAENIMHARLRLLKFAESHSLEELTQATLDESEALTASTMGFYHLVEADQRTLSLQTWSANTLAHMCTAEGKGQHYEVAKAGVWVDCVHQRRPVIHNDYNALPHRKGMPPGHAPVVRELVVPIFRANKIVAIIGVGNKPSDYAEWDVEAVSLLGDLSWDISERKRAETALRDREAKYRAAVETSADGFCITDMAGRFLELNDSFAVHLGYSPDEMLSMSVPDIEAQLTPAEIVAAIDKVRREGRAIFETKHRTKEGRVCPVEVNLAYWPIAGGRMFIFVRDIAERKRAEEALRESREDLNRAQAVAHIGSWRMNVQKNELTWSEENHRIFEILPGTPMTYETFLSTVHPEDREYVDREWMAALKGEPYDIEHRIIVDGTVKWVRERAELEFDSEGQLLGGFGTTQDITERKQAEAEIRRLASFPQMNPSPVLEIDATGAITFYNRASVKALEKLGPEAELSDLLPKDIGEIAATARQKKEQVFYREVEIRDAVFGQTIFFPEALDVLRIYSMDITQRKRAEEALRERTSQLEFANREMESFSYSVSHDLKAPLRAIQGFSRMLVGEHAAQLNTEGLRLLNVITSNTKLMAALIDDLLALSRWGRHEIRKGSINLTVMASQVFKQLKSQEPERDLQFMIKDLPPAHGDPSLIKQVMVNLLTNAVKYTKPRKTAVIEVGGKDEEKVTIYYVKDNGIGFDERYADKLFGVFQRLQSGEEYEGTGVGLAIVKRIIERHDGRVWAEGKVDEGATFYFTLPKNGARGRQVTAQNAL